MSDEIETLTAPEQAANPSSCKKEEEEEEEEIELALSHPRRKSSTSKHGVLCNSRRKIRRNPAVLIQWIEEHPLNPYPTKIEKSQLALYAGMNQRQLNDWFANARRNIKKVGYDKWKKKHSGYSAILSVQDMQYPHHHHHASIPGLGYPWSPVVSSGPLAFQQHQHHNNNTNHHHHHHHPPLPPLPQAPTTVPGGGYIGTGNRITIGTPFSMMTSGGESHTSSIVPPINSAPAYYPMYNGLGSYVSPSDATAEGGVIAPGQPVLMESLKHSPRAFRLVNTSPLPLPPPLPPPPSYKHSPTSPPNLIPHMLSAGHNHQCTPPQVECEDNWNPQRSRVVYASNGSSDGGSGGSVWGDASGGVWGVPPGMGGGGSGEEKEGNISKESSTTEDYYSPGGAGVGRDDVTMPTLKMTELSSCD